MKKPRHGNALGMREEKPENVICCVPFRGVLQDGAFFSLCCVGVPRRPMSNQPTDNRQSMALGLPLRVRPCPQNKSFCASASLSRIVSLEGTTRGFFCVGQWPYKKDLCRHPPVGQWPTRKTTSLTPTAPYSPLFSSSSSRGCL
nr:hypothetical protein [Pandoravirus massiliensis]